MFCESYKKKHGDSRAILAFIVKGDCVTIQDKITAPLLFGDETTLQ